MRLRKRLSVRKFLRRHPSLSVDVKTLPSGLIVVYARKGSDGKPYAAANGSDVPSAVYTLSENCLKLAALEAMDRQGWKDTVTGEVGKPLQAHHIQKRSAGRNDSAENLAAVTAETHSFQHEKSSSQGEAVKPPL